MADELNLEDNKDEKNPLQDRFNKLSEKIALSNKERDEKDALAKKFESEKLAAEKERDFYASFADVSATYTNAKDHKDEIKTKVLAGYTVEDATVSVLNKAGKLTQPQRERETVAGGSASNPPSKGPRPLNEMKRDELRQAIIDAESRGDISVS